MEDSNKMIGLTLKETSNKPDISEHNNKGNNYEKQFGKINHFQAFRGGSNASICFFQC